MYVFFSFNEVSKIFNCTVEENWARQTTEDEKPKLPSFDKYCEDWKMMFKQ
jgi:hypothetical protein